MLFIVIYFRIVVEFVKKVFGSLKKCMVYSRGRNVRFFMLDNGRRD